jgi:hypothetical protein
MEDELTENYAEEEDSVEGEEDYEVHSEEEEEDDEIY